MTPVKLRSFPFIPTKRPGLTTTIITGLVLGIVCGVFFGEYCAWLKRVGDVFVGLLQMTVLPYITFALVSNIGRLTAGQGKKLARIATALLTSAEGGSAWTVLYPQYQVVTPLPRHLSFPLIYAVAERDFEFLQFLNRWIELKKKEGVYDAVYEHWILGKLAEKKPPRWSVIRNVLHWVD